MSDEKKKFGKAGCIASIATVVLMFAGIMMVCYSVKLEAGGLLVPGIILAMLPLIVIPILTMLPAKLRGVAEVPRKERDVQLFMMLFAVMLLAGFLTGFIMVMTNSEDDRENVAPIIISGCVAAVGFIGVIITSLVNKRVTGNDSVTIQLFSEDEKAVKSPKRHLTRRSSPRIVCPPRSANASLNKSKRTRSAR